MSRKEGVYCVDEIQETQKLADILEPLSEIIRIAKDIRRAKKMLVSISTHRVTCFNTGTEAQKALPTVNKLLQRRITQGIRRLEELVATFKASEAIGAGDTPTDIGDSRLPRHGLGLASQDSPRGDDKAGGTPDIGDAKEASND